MSKILVSLSLQSVYPIIRLYIFSCESCSSEFWFFFPHMEVKSLEFIVLSNDATIDYLLYNVAIVIRFSFAIDMAIFFSFDYVKFWNDSNSRKSLHD